MIHNLNLTRDDPVIHLKAYGGVEIKGVDQAEVACEINAPQLATLVEEDGHVYITVNSSCAITVPSKASIQIEKGMGSIAISGVVNKIQIEKALGNLALTGVGEVSVEKVGGNFAVHQAAGPVQVEKVGGNLVLSEIDSFHCEKIGGSCKAKDIRGDFSLEKMGGGFKGQALGGLLQVRRVGGSFTARGATLQGELHVGGDVRLKDFKLADDYTEIHAGGDIRLEAGEGFAGANFEMRSAAADIRIKLGGDEIAIENKEYNYSMAGASQHMELAAGGVISLGEVVDPDEEIVGDLSDAFVFEESPLSEMIQERVESATRRAEARIKAAEIRLEQRVDKHRGFDINVDLGDDFPKKPVPPVPPVSRPVGKKGPSDEERLLILKMLQDKKITVDEAEKLFKALED